jgi:hypothetical protein
LYWGSHRDSNGFKRAFYTTFKYFTGLSIVPTNEWTMDLKGAKQIKMVGLGDKRQITALINKLTQILIKVNYCS